MGLMRQELIILSRIVTRKKVSSILMLGMQDILADLNDLEQDFLKFSIDYDKNAFDLLKTRKYNSVDFFYIFPQVNKVHAMDYSPYEDADIIYDLNTFNTPKEYIGVYDLVIDGGTLEHIFNQSAAINNINRFVKNNGFVYHMLPCAGWVNHGFYNYSPTYFEDVYCKKSGFELVELRLCFKQPKGQKSRLLFSQDCRLYSMAEINRTISEMATDGGVMLYCLAKKDNDVFGQWEPMQTMYKNMYASKMMRDLDWSKMVQVLKDKEAFYLYGGGYWCNCLINEIIRADFFDKVVGVFDSDINRAEGVFRGKKIMYPSKHNLDNAGLIVISTRKFEHDVYRILKENEVNDIKILKMSDFEK